MTICLELIESALVLTGRLGVGRASGPSEKAESLRVLNRMIAGWNCSPLNIFTSKINLWNTVTNQQSYTIGQDPSETLTPDWDGDRPQRITQANLLLPTASTSIEKIRRPLAIWSDEDWAKIRYQAVYTYPQGLYNDGASPLARIYFHPIPDAVYQIELYTWQAVQSFLTVDDAVLLPLGYEDAIVQNLALKLFPVFQIPVNPDVRRDAMLSLSKIRELNANAPRMITDEANATGRGTYNWLSGQNDL